MGRKKRPFYRLIVTDSRNRRDGAYLANLGYYDPFAEPYEAKLQEEEILAWLRKGATMSETARTLVQREGILYRWELERQGLDATEVAAKVAFWRADFASREADRTLARADAARVAKETEAVKKAAEEDERKATEAAAAAEAAKTAAGESEAEPSRDGTTAEAADADATQDEG